MSTEKNNKTCELPSKYHVFSLEESERGEIDLIEFSIDTVGDAHPIRQPLQ